MLVELFDVHGVRDHEVAAATVLIEPETFLTDGAQGPLNRKIADWLKLHSNLAAVAIKFNKFTDGRACSLAARLREAGYTGELHAVGDITQDLIFLLRRVGFTHFDLSGQGVQRVESKVVQPFGGHYQGAQDGSLPWVGSDRG
jgi:uncharacterized protein (DUF934 family)